jgi:hypothetical protein
MTYLHLQPKPEIPKFTPETHETRSKSKWTALSEFDSTNGLLAVIEPKGMDHIVGYYNVCGEFRSAGLRTALKQYDLIEKVEEPHHFPDSLQEALYWLDNNMTKTIAECEEYVANV